MTDVTANGSSDGSRRRIGGIGATARALVGLGLLLLAGGVSISSWTVTWYDALGGLVALPALGVALGLLARRQGSGPIRLTGPLSIAINCCAIVVLVSNPVTSGAAMLFYGATLLLAAGTGQPGCEATVISNLLLGRDDQVGCPVFSPIDAAETRLRAGIGLPT